MGERRDGVKESWRIGVMEDEEEQKQRLLETIRRLPAVAGHLDVIGIPKTIDNDLSFIQNTFRFETAVAEAKRSIERLAQEPCDGFHRATPGPEYRGTGASQ
jgi:hypothetical protein